MACKIRILDEQTINQIAAGEVVENPASVIKEIVDNSIDAKATKIVIEVQGSGRHSIMVQDNGCGMSRDDALLCLERHATSKIRSADDLWSLSTMGFRGEALASIGAVSELSLLTAEHNGSEETLLDGTSLMFSAGRVLSCCTARCFAGTKISIRSLFHNVPARRKFQKSPIKEAHEIVKVVSQLALAYPEIAFELHVNTKKELSLPTCSKESYMSRIKEILGAESASQTVSVDYSKGAISLWGVIGKPFAARTNRSGQFLFVNRRPIESLLLSSALKEAYGASIEETKHPLFVLHVDIAPDCVDVNVHPQKRHVRFCIEDEIKQACSEMIRQTLFDQALSNPSPFSVSPVTQLANSFPQREASFTFSQKPLHVMQPHLSTVAPSFRVIGTLWHYIFVHFAGEEEHFCVFDAQLAISRITSESFAKNEEKKARAQMLLEPIFLEFSVHEALQLREKLSFFQQLGLHLHEFGPHSFLLDALAPRFEYVDIQEWIRNFLNEGSAESIVEQMKSVGSSAQKLSLPISEEQAFQIIKKLLLCSEPLRCPAGLPTRVRISKSELTKKFREVL